MLILPHANGFRINFYQLRQRILQPSGYGRGTSLSNIKIGKFLRCQFAGGIHGSSRLIYDHILHFFRNLFQQFYNNLFRFPGSRSIAHRKQCNMILADQFLQCFLRCRYLDRGSGRRRIDYRGIQHFSGWIHYRQLTAGTEGRIPPKHCLPLDGRLHQKLLQVFAKYRNGPILRLLRKVIADLPLDGRGDQALIAVRGHFS